MVAIVRCASAGPLALPHRPEGHSETAARSQRDAVSRRQFGNSSGVMLLSLTAFMASTGGDMGDVQSFPSFVDLRAFADACVAALPAPPETPSWQDLPLPPGPVTVGVLLLPPGRHAAVAEADEFIVVHAGAVTVAAGGTARAFGDGESFVIRAGTALEWEARSRAVLISMRCRGTASGAHAVVAIDRDAALEASGAPSSELLVSPVPSCRNHTDYRSDDGEFMCGVWDSTPYTRKAMRYRHYELMHLLDGEVTFVDADGVTGTFSQGDIFVVRKDAECSWDSQAYVRKVYSIWRPA